MQTNSANRINFSETFPVGVTNRINRLPAQNGRNRSDVVTAYIRGVIGTRVINAANSGGLQMKNNNLQCREGVADRKCLYGGGVVLGYTKYQIAVGRRRQMMNFSVRRPEIIYSLN